VPVVEVTDGVVAVLEPELEELGVEEDEVDVEEVVEVEDELDDDVVVTAAAVRAPVEPPLYDRAATEPKTPTAATLAMAVPTVSVLRRATARSRSPGLRRVAALVMKGECRSNLSLS
jgi:hypothetical protein